MDLPSIYHTYSPRLDWLIAATGLVTSTFDMVQDKSAALKPNGYTGGATQPEERQADYQGRVLESQLSHTNVNSIFKQ